MELAHLISVFDIEAEALEASIKGHPSLSPFFSPDAPPRSVDELRDGYLRLLKMSADYVRYSVPALRASGEALRAGDEEDRAWGDLFLEYAQGETVGEERLGHQVWAMNDMRALGAPPSLLDAPPHPLVLLYGKFLVEDARLHPYAILGTKGVLEHFSLRICDDLVKSVIASGLASGGDATTFFHHHGVLDIEHVRAGDENLGKLRSPEKRAEVLGGAYFTGGSYRAFLRLCV